MRPLTRPPFPARWTGIRADDAAAAAFGTYCAICEQRLPQEAVGWDAAREVPFAAPASAGRWDDLLLLCRQCAAASEAVAAFSPRRGDAFAAPLLRPDRDRTFALGAPSPLGYVRARLEVRTADGAALEPVERVLATGLDARGEATIGRYLLNTAAHSGDALVLPPEAPDLVWFEHDDPRLQLRTAAWAAAAGAAELLREAPDEHRRLALSQARGLLRVTGFWSVWATVLWERLGDRELLADLLLPPEPVTRAGAQLPPPPGAEAEAAAPAPVGGSDAFAATRTDWLPSSTSPGEDPR